MFILEEAAKTGDVTTIPLPPTDGLPPLVQWIVLALAGIATAVLAWRGVKLAVKVASKPTDAGKG